MREKENTLATFKDFAETSLWRDIQFELFDWLDQVHINLEDGLTGTDKLPSGLTDKELHRLGGNAEAIRKMINVMDYIIQDLEQQNEEEN